MKHMPKVGLFKTTTHCSGFGAEPSAFPPSVPSSKAHGAKARETKDETQYHIISHRFLFLSDNNNIFLRCPTDTGLCGQSYYKNLNKIRLRLLATFGRRTRMTCLQSSITICLKRIILRRNISRGKFNTIIRLFSPAVSINHYTMNNTFYIEFEYQFYDIP